MCRRDGLHVFSPLPFAPGVSRLWLKNPPSATSAALRMGPAVRTAMTSGAHVRDSIRRAAAGVKVATAERVQNRVFDRVSAQTSTNPPPYEPAAWASSVAAA